MSNRWVGLVIAALALTCGCGGDDNNDGQGSVCSEACGIYARLCGSDTRQPCLQGCSESVPQMSQEQIDSTMACMRAAQTCDEADSCTP